MAKDLVSGGDGNDKLLGGAGRASPVYYFCHIDLTWPAEYPAGIHQTRDHAGDPSPERDSIPSPHGPTGLFGLENRGMNRMAESEQTKVRHGGTPANSVWKMAA